MSYETLFTPIIINRMELKSRVIMAPTRENLASEDSSVTPEMVDFYLKRARGGVSMITLGAVGVNPRRSPFMPLINDDKFIPGLKGLVDRIHSETGVKVCAQLSDWLKLARGWKQDINEVTPEEIEVRLDSFEKGAIRAKEAGFDAIELPRRPWLCPGLLSLPEEQKRRRIRRADREKDENSKGNIPASEAGPGEGLSHRHPD